VSKKQKTYAFEFFSYAVIFLAAFGVWVLLQSLTLVIPEPVQAASPKPVTPVVVAPAKVDVSKIVDKQVEKQIKLQQTIEDFARAQNGTYGIFVKSLDGGVAAIHNVDAQMYSASLYKLFAAQLTYTKVDSGQWSLTQPILENIDLEQCLDKMITVSDNDCGIAIIKKLGFSNVNAEAMKALGYPSTDLSGEYTKSSALDVAKLLEDLYDGELLNKSSNQAFLDLLAAQKINDRLPQGLPDGVQIMHKTGDLAGYVHDAGIVRSVDGSSYIIVVMSGPDPTIPNYAQRYVPFAELSREVYEIMIQG